MKFWFIRRWSRWVYLQLSGLSVREVIHQHIFIFVFLVDATANLASSFCRFLFRSTICSFKKELGVFKLLFFIFISDIIFFKFFWREDKWFLLRWNELYLLSCDYENKQETCESQGFNNGVYKIHLKCNDVSFYVFIKLIWYPAGHYKQGFHDIYKSQSIQGNSCFW